MTNSTVIGFAGPIGSGKDTSSDFLIKNYHFKRISFADALYKECADAYGVSVSQLQIRETKEVEQDAYAMINLERIDISNQFINAVLDHAVFNIDGKDLQAIKQHFKNEGIDDVDMVPFEDVADVIDELSEDDRMKVLMPKPYSNDDMDKIMHHPRSPRSVLQWWGTEFRRNQNISYWTDKVEETVINNPGRWVLSDVRFDNEEDLLRRLGGKIVLIKPDPLKDVSNAHASELFWQKVVPDAEVTNKFGDTSVLYNHLSDLMEEWL